jgi:hypothetical protein
MLFLKPSLVLSLLLVLSLTFLFPIPLCVPTVPVLGNEPVLLVNAKCASLSLSLKVVI